MDLIRPEQQHLAPGLHRSYGSTHSRSNTALQGGQNNVSERPSLSSEAISRAPSLHSSSSGAHGLPLQYVSQLPRSRSAWSVAFMAFILSAVPYGLSTTLIYPLLGGGPVTIIWGWVLVSLLMLCVAVSLGEITSAYPVAGGVYFQTFMLSPPWCREMIAWITGWAFVLGNIIITLSVNFGTTLLLVSCIQLFHDVVGYDPVSANPYHVYLIFVVVTLLCNTASALGNRYLAAVDTAAMIMTFLSVIAVLCYTLVVAKEGRHTATYVFTDFHPISGWPSGIAFLVGLLHAAYATSATGMVVSMCDEVQQPATEVPRAIFYTVLMNMLCGLLFLIPLTFILPDISSIVDLSSGQPLPFIIRSAVGGPAEAFALCAPIIILGIFCGLACTTAASRTTWAFARDGAIPGSHIYGFDLIDSTRDVPLNAMLLNMVLQLLLGLLSLISSAAFNAFNGAGVIFLTISYVIPIAVSFCSGRGALKSAEYNLGALGAVCNVVSIAWCLLAIPLFCMPARLPVTFNSMNYAGVVFVGDIVIAAVWYAIQGRWTFQGPVLHEGSKSSFSSEDNHDD